MRFNDKEQESGARRSRHQIRGHRVQAANETMSHDEQEYERTRRSLIYADMLSRTGQILYSQLATWTYQPTDDEVEATITRCKDRNRAYRLGIHRAG